MAYDIETRGDSLAFSQIWVGQALPDGVREALAISADQVREVITNPALPGQNISEWAKTQACWNRVRELRVPWPLSLQATLTSYSEAKEEKRGARRDKRQISGIEAQSLVFQKGHAYWQKALSWGHAGGHLSHKEAGLLQAAARPGSVATDAQSIQIIAIERKLIDSGFG